MNIFLLILVADKVQISTHKFPQIAQKQSPVSQKNPQKEEQMRASEHHKHAGHVWKAFWYRVTPVSLTEYPK
jgi:hypothetical protein